MGAGDDIEFIELERPRHSRGHEAGPRRTVILGLVATLLAALAALTVAAPMPQPVEVASPPLPATTSTADPGTVLQPGEIDGAGAVLGSPVGLELWVGGDSPVTRLDLDTGNILTLDYRAYPIMATGLYLVLFDARNDVFITIERSDPTARPKRLEADDGFVIDAVAPGLNEGTVWVADRGAPDQVEWRLLSLETVSPVQSATTDSIITSRLPYRIEVAVPPIIDVRGDELYVLRFGAFDLWLEGGLVVHDGRRALVETCEVECRRAWYDIATGDELAIPPPTDLFEQNELIGDWIHSKTRDGSEAVLVELVTSRSVDTQERVRGRQFDISPDGRWGAFTGAQRLRITDLSVDESVEMTTVSNRVGTSTSLVLTDAG